MARLPERLGPLKLVHQLGSGRHCQIWEAIDERSGQRVAVKAVVPDKADAPEQRRLLRQELKVARSLDHPAVIRIDRLEEQGGVPHLVLELFPHPNLKRQITAGTDGLASRLQRIVTELSLALDHLHARGWVHRDVKPENVLAAPDGQVKLIDLAIAVPAAGFLGRLLGRGVQPQGSPSYMSPEQIRGGPLDARSDIYSFGCVLFELLAGRPPFTATNSNDLLNKHVAEPAPSIEKFNRNVTTNASELLRCLLAKKPAARPASMKRVLRRLRSIRLLERLPG